MIYYAHRNQGKHKGLLFFFFWHIFRFIDFHSGVPEGRRSLLLEILDEFIANHRIKIEQNGKHLISFSLPIIGGKRGKGK